MRWAVILTGIGAATMLALGFNMIVPLAASRIPYVIWLASRPQSSFLDWPRAHSGRHVPSRARTTLRPCSENSREKVSDPLYEPRVKRYRPTAAAARSIQAPMFP